MAEAVQTAVDPSLEVTAARRTTLAQILQITVLTILSATVVMSIVTAGLALRWVQTPFLGGFVEHTLAFNDVRVSGSEAWPVFQRGVKPTDLLVAIDGRPILTNQNINEVLSGHQVGDQVTLTVEHQDGSRAEVPITLLTFSTNDLVTYFAVPWFIGFVYLLIGLLVFFLRRGEVAGRAFALFCATTAVVLIGLFDLYTTHIFTWAWTLCIPAASASAITLVLVFPQEANFVQKWPNLRLISYVPMAGLAAYALTTLYGPLARTDPLAYISAWRYQYYFMAAGILFFFGIMVYRWMLSPSPLAREQSRIILIGALLAFSLIMFWAISPLVGFQSFEFNASLFLPPLILFPAAVAYALLRYRLLDTDRRVAQGLVYVAMAILTVAAYGLILTGASLMVGAMARADDPVVLGLTVFLLVALFNPVRDRLLRLVDYTFFRGTRTFARRVEAFGRALTRAAGLDDIAGALNEQLEAALRPSSFYLFLFDSVTDEYAAYTGQTSPGDLRRRTDVRFLADGPLATVLRKERTALYLTPERPLPENLVRDRTRLAMLGTSLYVPLPGKSGLSGWLSLGAKLSGEPFTRDDLRFVEALADQSALAIERATVISDLERRVSELNVLSQMSQAVNFTIGYDDLLELIYAQASKIVDTRNFYIILKDPRGQTFSYSFFVENNERINEEENKAWPANRGLSAEVVRTGQPIRTDDYQDECRRRSVIPRPKDFKAWMGVPLNAGAETIGVMAVAVFEPEVTFTEEQLKVFWAIADQAASAIVKASLFRQTEERARQLATLNEVSTSMSSTLDLDALLERIVQSSVNILACDAGSLFLTDDETGEYVFRVAVGPVGQNLVGMRIAPGKGFVGEAIESGVTLIVNDVQSDPRWFKGSDEATGFVTKALMVVPLRFQDRAIGAVEVINKRDGSPYNADDQNLLTAFAGPAAVAIQNARLFQQTDQALASRVEELSAMQRIDRELNTTLDVRRVMSLTLGWAMKNTGALAGAVGVVNENGIMIVATEGYDESNAPLQNMLLPRDKGLLGQVVQSGDIRLVRDVKSHPDYQPFLATTQAQLVIPILREREVVGLINLESSNPDAFTPEQVEFVVRLVDHASVAITNARLYAEVNAANIAKSEFISFVAHELKTPMTSIRGYTDLLVGSAVGPITDMQKQFLGTIRGNVDRMATLVSDLADIARIESGRLRLEAKAIPFQVVVDDVVHTTKALIDAKRQTLVLEIEPNLPHIWADFTRTAQVLTNLTSNAHKYTPEDGEIVLRVAKEPDPLATGAAAGQEMLHVSVKDNGIGIAPEDQKKLFQKFFRAEDRVAREMATGTGLGLNIVKNLVELQGGHIWFDSEFRRGSTFHFTLPFAPVEEKVVA
jgi:signal transduction histidine kinase